MLNRLALHAFMAVALLTSSMVFASAAAPGGDAVFLASLEAPQAATAPVSPALTSADRAPAPMACTFTCQSCSLGGGVGKQFCTTCNGVKSCGSCNLFCQF
jgi:hypothetical protein